MAKDFIKVMLKFFRWVLTILILIVLVAVVTQRLSNNKISFFGYGVYTIVSESMKPEYEIGDMLLAKAVDKKDIRVGDDIVYLGKVDTYENKVVTHRVIKIDNMIHTKGISNDIEDPPIEYEQVYGKVVSKFVVLSAFSKLMNNSAMFYIIIFVPFTLLVFFDINGIIKDKKALEEEKIRKYNEEMNNSNNSDNQNNIENTLNDDEIIDNVVSEEEKKE